MTLRHVRTPFVTERAPHTNHHRAPVVKQPVLLYHLRHAIRLLGRDRAFTLVALLTLVIGVGGNVAVFAVVEAVLLRPLPYVDAHRLIVLKHRDRGTGVTKEFIALGDHIDLAARESVFERLSGYGGFQGTLVVRNEAFRVTGLQAAPGLLETLRVAPALGRAFRGEDAREGAAPVVLIGHDLWQARFGGEPNVVGRGIVLDDRERQIVGVMPRGFAFPMNAATGVIVPLALPAQAPAERRSGWTFAIARLKPDVSIEQATANLSAVSRQLEQEYPRSNEGTEYFAVPLRDALVGDTKEALVLLLSAVGVVLLIACANVANLLLARSIGRRQEMSVRMALGAGRGRLVAQLLAEALVLAVAAGAAGIAVAHVSMKALVALVPASVSVAGMTDVRINSGVLAFTFGLSLLTALLFGVASALAVRSQQAAGALTLARATIGRTARRTTSVLAVAEVALAVVLLIGAGLILRSFAALLAVDPGFTPDGVLTMSVAVPAQRYREAAGREAFYRRAFEAVQRTPGVEEVGAGVVVPLTGNNWTVPFERVDRPAPPGERPPDVGWQLASGGFFRSLRVPLMAGRLFDHRDGPDGRPVVIISEAIQQRYFPGESAVGKHVKLGDGPMEIVGVVGNIRRAALTDEPRADMYFPFERATPPQITLFVRASGDSTAAGAHLQSVIQTIEPAAVVDGIRTMNAIANESLQITRLALWLLSLFAVAALALAAIGIYGVLAYAVRQRTKEIGTRVALGATPGRIVWLVMRDGMSITAVGVAIGLAAGLVAARFLGGILYEVSASDPATASTAIAVLVVAAMTACYLPARRAASVDPARTLVEP